MKVTKPFGRHVERRKSGSEQDREKAFAVLIRVRDKELAEDHPEARKAIKVVGAGWAQDVVHGSRAPASTGRSTSDAMFRRVPGSFGLRG